MGILHSYFGTRPTLLYTTYILGWSVRGKLWEVVLDPLALLNLLPEDVLLVQEEDDGHRPQPPVVPDALK